MEKRIEYIDIAKGIGILCVVLGHVNLWDKLDMLIHGFHMPLFFFVSGYLFKVTDIRYFILKKIKTLLWPYLLFYLLNLVLSPFVEGMPIGGGTWFLLALFYAEVIYYIVVYLAKKEIYIDIICFCITILGLALSLIIPNRTLLYVGSGLVAIAFIRFGNLYRNKIKELNFNIGKAGIMIILYVVLSVINGNVNMKEGIYSNWIIFILDALIGIYVVFYISQQIDISKSKAISLVSVYLTRIGKNSIVYFLFNQTIIFIFMNLFSEFSLNKHIIKIIVFIISVVTLFLLDLVMNKTKIIKILGR